MAVPAPPPRGPLTPPPWSLRSYAFIADGERGALIDPAGSIAWLCAPAWDSEPVFDSLLGGPGHYQVAPVGRYVWGGHYEDRSLIWRSRWATPDGIVECREALVFPGASERAVLLRRIESVQGTSQMRIRLRCHGPRSGEMDAPRRIAEGAWLSRLGDLQVRWSGDVHTRRAEAGAGLEAETVARPHSHTDLILELSATALDGQLPEADDLWRRTEHAWDATMPKFGSLFAGRDATHSYAVLRGLTTGSGGMVAAATTSLPERAERHRDYDYRYAWVRDQVYAGRAANAAGCADLFDSSVAFIKDRLLADGAQLRPVYRPDGSPIPAKAEPLDLPGYPGAEGPHAGNDAATQFQLDCFGEALLLLADAARAGRLEADGWRAAEVAAEAIAQRWHEPDSGIWELPERWWTSSRLVAAAGLRALASTAPQAALAARWEDLSQTILAEARATAVHSSGRWQRAQDDDRCDASLLVGQIRGLLPADDPQAAATRRGVEEDLTVDGFVFRFPEHDQPLGSSEGAFLLCNFWLALAQLGAGQGLQAVATFERARSAVGPPAVFAEEYDVWQRQLRGNQPQAFVHALLLETAVTLSRDLGIRS